MIGLNKIIANNIFALRNKHNLTQQEFVDRLNIGISRGHLSHIETGKNIPSAEIIKAICIKFNVTADWLLDNNLPFVDPATLIDPSLNLINKFNALSKSEQNLVMQLIEALLK